MSPLQNRVRPDGELVAVPERGTMMGNRGGRIHDLETRTLGRRRWASRAWICCVLQYRDWYAEPWTDHYTELFFLDEVTALAAGHRPCYLCRRTDAVAFAAAVAARAGLTAPPTAPELDRRLHAERLDGASKRRHRERWTALPDGSVVEVGGGFAALRGDGLLPWSFAGYGPPAPRPGSGAASVLTPPTVLAALRGGYRPGWHESAGPGR
jgi:hypothetical protein